MEIPTMVESLDMRYRIDTRVEIAQVPTDVPLGPNVLLENDQQKLCPLGRSV